jgi:serine/threonine protein phosphatase PrpC
MRFESQTFWLPKDLGYPDEYQDAFDLDCQRGIAVIADGVSSAIFSGLWARLVTAATCAQPPDLEHPEQFHSWLQELRQSWRSQIDVSQLAFYQRPKLVDGAMTTLLWMTLSPQVDQQGEPTGNYNLQAFAVGDCVLFQVREGQLLQAFPLTNAAEFDLSPAVVGSVDRKRDHLLEFKMIEYECQPDDLLVLCTDAIGLWAIGRSEAGEPVDWERYWGLSQAEWAADVAAQRNAFVMRHDDSTLMLLRVVKELDACTPSPDQAEPARQQAPLEAEPVGEVAPPSEAETPDLIAQDDTLTPQP